MCGVVGFWAARAFPFEPAAELRKMAAALAHRGPDDEGTFWDGAAGIGLGHRRLSIIDLSAEGHQPMESASGRYVIVFNGEVYNFRAIRAELEGGAGAPSFRGHSDTEVMLAAIETFGVVRAVERFVGMFAFALWDRRERRLHLVRDRLGVKPLYYGFAGGRLVFGSELNALAVSHGFSRDIDPSALAAYLRYGYVPSPHGIYRAVRKVAPGSVVTFRAPEPAAAEHVRYWSAADVATQGIRSPLACSDDEAIRELERLIDDAVGLRMVADVPLGAFLSGGVDSSTVVARMQALSARPVRTFSIGFADANYDESRAAEAVARHLGTDHTALTVTDEEVLPLVPKMAEVYDEPFADSSQLPTYVVSQLARKDVTVALSGDGGDELFGGYNRHVWGPRLWAALRRVPVPARRAVRAALFRLSPEQWDRVFAALGPAAPRVRLAGNKVHKLSGALLASSVGEMYRTLASRWDNPGALLVSQAEEARNPLLDARLETASDSMMLWDAVSYLPDDIMTKVDRASMAVSLEAREPLLDHRLFEFAWRLPREMKIRDGETKWLLRRVLYRSVPEGLVNRPKMGFAVPIGQWLRGPLREWAEELLRPSALAIEGLLDGNRVQGAWREHLSGRRNLGEELWTIIAFEAWARQRAR
jgi:asparagine synthase (glutamine-hydrolysing)